jgi:hypothetical protein
LEEFARTDALEVGAEMSEVEHQLAQALEQGEEMFHHQDGEDGTK